MVHRGELVRRRVRFVFSFLFSLLCMHDENCSFPPLDYQGARVLQVLFRSSGMVWWDRVVVCLVRALGLVDVAVVRLSICLRGGNHLAAWLARLMQYLR